MVDKTNGDTAALPDFGGHPLAQVPGLAAAHIASFKNLGFTDAEQVMAALAVPDVMDGMKTAIGASDASFDDLVRR
jgi:hypothetical protein